MINAGTILSTVDGQAIDFDAIASATDGQIEIDNLAGGTIQSTDADALRPGQGAVINNAGTIYAGKVTNDSSDGVDFQDHSGTVHNLTGGLISGARHGITTDADVTVINDAGATILGRNGSGVGSDGTATVTNYGTITGAYDGSGNGDGDGVDIDGNGFVENYGTIQALGFAGVHSDGRPNGSDGVAIGGTGTVINHAGALIYSVGGAVPMTTGTVINDGTITGDVAGVLFGNGPGTLVNTGIITGGTWVGALGSPVADTFTNSGTISSSATAIDMAAGDDQLTLLPGSVIVGTVDGGEGRDQVTLAGDGDGSFAGAVNFEHLEVASGRWTLTGASTYSEGTTIETGASLTGSADTLTGDIEDLGVLIVDQPGDASFTASLSGTGQFVKTGAGTLTIGDQAFTGPTDVTGGILRVVGQLSSAVTVETGGALAGTGSVSAVTVQSGGQIAPGADGIGTLGIAGDLVQKAGSVYAADIASDGTADLLQVGGTATIEPGAKLSVAGAGSDTIGKRYVLLTAAGGVSGNYTELESLAAGTELRSGNDGTDLYVVVARNAEGLALAARSADQGVAASVGSLGASSLVNDSLTLNASDDEVRQALYQLDGDVHASVRTGMIQDTLLIDGAVRTRLESHADIGRGIWAQFLGGHGRDDTGDGMGDTDRDILGVLGGVDLTLGSNVHAGIAGGYTSTRLWLDGARAQVHAGHLIGYVGADLAAFRLRGTIGYSWDHLSTRRNVSFGDITDRDTARYHGDVLHGSGEVAYAFGYGAASVEPFVRATVIRVHTDGFSETGGIAALDGAGHGNTASFSNVGLRLAMPVLETLSIRASASWQHAYGNLHSTALLAFEDGGSPFTAIGSAVSRDAVSPGLDLTWTVTPGLRFSAGYNGLFGSNDHSNAGRAMLSFDF